MGLDWTVTESKEISKEGNCFGSTHCDGQKIFLDPDDTTLHREQTLLHEIMHAIWWETGLKERYKDNKTIEEEIISSITPCLYQVLKDNKLLTK